MEFDRFRLFDNLQTDQVKIGDYGYFGFDPFSAKRVIESGKPVSRGIITAIHPDCKIPYEKNYGQCYSVFYKMTKEEFCKRVPCDSAVVRLINEIK